MKNLKTLVASLLVGALVLSSCSKEKDDPIVPNEEEVITTLKYTLTPTDGGEVVVLSFKDLDGDGGEAPVITEGKLEVNKIYTGKLVLLNEQESPAEDITEEIEEENEAHQFFFKTDIDGLTVVLNDEDANKKPLGLKSTLTTKNAGDGTLKITLRHEPNKSGKDVASGDITNAGGETDIEVTFKITVVTKAP